MRVCKQGFCQIHAIGKQRVEVLCEKIASGIFFYGDDRGKHKNFPHTIAVELKAQIWEDISFPCRESHYPYSDNRGCKYLREGLKFARMYSLYLEHYDP